MITHPSPSAIMRQRFLDFFARHNHTIVPSSPVVPHDDPTLLFTNAGMNQFKELFLGKSRREYSRATTSQKCIRVGGKHNDLENVGHTRRHLTFFEMLGNFSFGDYFKEQAIDFAWKVATEVFEFDTSRIWATVFQTDDEAYKLWLRYLPAERIARLGEADNFWAMGDTGPCGPCSELLYDRGEKYGTATSPTQPDSGERFLEFWNLVFMQYNRQVNGELQPLAKPSIDTGAGLERLISLKLDVENVFATDILRGIIDQIALLSGIPYDPKASNAPAFHVISDHLRSLSFSIADGVIPSNVDRGYVLRKLLRRAVRYGKQLGFTTPFLGNLLPTLIALMGEAYPELIAAEKQIAQILFLEEENFFRTLRRGGNLLQQIIQETQEQDNRCISGDDAFKLKDTYGLPFEEISLIAKDHHLEVDHDRYTVLEAEAKERSRQAHKTVNQIAETSLFEAYLKVHPPTQFLGYNQSTITTKVVALLKEGKWVEMLTEGEGGIILLENTPFYAEMGGQVGDIGTIVPANHSNQAHFQVIDCKHPYAGIHAHVGEITHGTLSLGDAVIATIDTQRRARIECNHTATHLLHWALEQVLGSHIKQAGSLVDPDRMRFDFSHISAMIPQEIREVERLVNQEIRKDHPVAWYNLPYAEAQKRSDIKQFFGDKYGATVRVVDINTSKELCGGTHTSNLSRIGYFRIVKESSCAAGIRRVEAVSGQAAEDLAYEDQDLLTTAGALLKSTPAQLPGRIASLQEELKEQAQELKRLKEAQLAVIAEEIISEACVCGLYTVAMGQLSLPPAELRSLATLLSKRLPPNGVFLLGSIHEQKATLYLQCLPNAVKAGAKANVWIEPGKALLQAAGGGKAELAQASSAAIDQLPQAMAAIKEAISSS